MTPEYIATLFRSACQSIAAEPQKWTQGHWASTFDTSTKPMRYATNKFFNHCEPAAVKPFCGTACCLAGWLALHNDEYIDDLDEMVLSVFEIIDFGDKLCAANDNRWATAFYSLFQSFKLFFTHDELYDILVSLSTKSTSEIMDLLDQMSRATNDATPVHDQVVGLRALFNLAPDLVRGTPSRFHAIASE